MNLISCISTTAEIDALIDAHAPILLSVSGGKDSRLAAKSATAYAHARGHRGDIKLIYANVNSSDVQMTWADARSQCEWLAEHLGIELVVVQRAAGGLMERWQQRWRDNVARYVNLLAVKLILPWSQNGVGRFCTSELKTAIIQRWIRQHYKQPVICVLGIRRDEGNVTRADGKVIKRKSGRALAPVATPYDGKDKKGLPAGSFDWNAVVDVSTETALEWILAAENTPSAYLFGAKRFSCCHCIFCTPADHRAALRDPRNHPAYIAQCRLEIDSTFSFQGNHWLSDYAPEILPTEFRARIPEAKAKAREREEIESLIPNHLLYKNDGGKHGWPRTLPNFYEATIIAHVRQRMGEIMGFETLYTTPQAVQGRYAELIAEKAARDQRRRRKPSLQLKSDRNNQLSRRSSLSPKSRKLPLTRTRSAHAGPRGNLTKAPSGAEQ